MSLEHNNFKDEYKINEQVNKTFNIRRQMSILVAFEWHYFQELLNWWQSPFKGQLVIQSWERYTVVHQMYRSASKWGVVGH